jgi:predicted Fe-Mo cluster-binding NifX family protein
MNIAVASQNRREVTGHLGRCRRFWIYEVEGKQIKGKRLLELPKEQSLHESHGAPHPLDEVQVVISGGMGEGMVRRLATKNIEGIVTPETDPDAAVKAYLVGALRGMPEMKGRARVTSAKP